MPYRTVLRKGIQAAHADDIVVLMLGRRPTESQSLGFEMEPPDDGLMVVVFDYY